MTLKGYHLPTLAKAIVQQVSRDRVMTLAAAAAYSFFFSLFPLMLVLAPIAGLLGNPRDTVDLVMAQLVAVMPAEHTPVVNTLVESVVFAPNAPGLMSLGIVLAAWAGSNVIGRLQDTLNTAYGVEERRPFWRQIIVRLGMFLLATVILAFATLVFLQGDRIAAWAGDLLEMQALTVRAWQVLQVLLAFGALILLCFVIYYFLPRVRQNWKHVLVASTFTTIAWALATLLFRMYFEFFPPNPAYGFVGAVIVLLTWMYYTMLIVLLGGELGSELAKGTGKRSLSESRGERAAA